MTGLAGGDHLHFSMQVQGRPVNPVEWWDPHWIEDRVLRKLREAGGQPARARRRRRQRPRRDAAKAASRGSGFDQIQARPFAGMYRCGTLDLGCHQPTPRGISARIRSYDLASSIRRPAAASRRPRLVGALVTSTGSGLSVPAWPSTSPAGPRPHRRARPPAGPPGPGGVRRPARAPCRGTVWRFDPRPWMKGLSIAAVAARRRRRPSTAASGCSRCCPAFFSVFHAALAQVFVGADDRDRALHVARLAGDASVGGAAESDPGLATLGGRLDRRDLRPGAGRRHDAALVRRGRPPGRPCHPRLPAGVRPGGAGGGAGRRRSWRWRFSTA